MSDIIAVNSILEYLILAVLISHSLPDDVLTGEVLVEHPLADALVGSWELCVCEFSLTLFGSLNNDVILQATIWHAIYITIDVNIVFSAFFLDLTTEFRELALPLSLTFFAVLLSLIHHFSLRISGTMRSLLGGSSLSFVHML